jgi:predicted AAA+ superfamily ATPase
MEYGLTYWRDGKYEVDFVIERGKDIWAVEVKSGGAGLWRSFSVLRRGREWFALFCTLH